MQDDTFNEKFDGVPLNDTARAYIQQDNFGEWIGGNYYDLSGTTAAQRANPAINANALYAVLSQDDNGGLGAIMAATGYSLSQQYAALSQADLNTGRPQKVDFDVAVKNSNNQDAVNFLEFNGKLALAGGLGAGLTATGELGAITVNSAARSAVIYTSTAGAFASLKYIQTGGSETFASTYNQHSNERGLVGSMLVSGVGAAYLGQMFQWAGLPAAGTGAGWLTPAGVVLRANAAVTGWGTNKATQAYLDSSNR